MKNQSSRVVHLKKLPSLKVLYETNPILELHSQKICQHLLRRDDDKNSREKKIV